MGHFNDTHYCSKCGTFTNDINRIGEKWICGGCQKPKEEKLKKNEMG